MDTSTSPGSPMLPDGYIPSYKNPEANAYIATDVVKAFLPLMLVFFFLRLYSRGVVVRKFGTDDAFSAISAASIIVTCAFLVLLINGKTENPPTIHTVSYSKRVFTFLILTSLSTLLAKLALLTLYLRIFNPSRNVTLAIYVCLVIVTGFYLSTVIAELVVGLPSNDAGWTQGQNKVIWGTFGLTVSVVRGVFGVVSDFAILLIPMTQLIRLALPMRRRIILSCVFLTGLLACASSIVTTVFRFAELNDPDNTLADTLTNSFVIIELTVGHICCSLPTLPPMIKRLNKTTFIISITRYVRSSKTKRSESDLPVSESSNSERNQLPNVPRSGLRGLRSFMQKAGFTNASVKPTRNYSDLESIDLDYHAQLKKATKAQDLAQHN
ncbi:hypothetical protein F4861DRAFT_63956 [Xylaria intraflava]|nr:hypothetical protein F4861DRAFT_63956 [Xylaria intraflava]